MYRQKFIEFVNKLKTPDNEILIESVKQTYHKMFESSDFDPGISPASGPYSVSNEFDGLMYMMKYDGYNEFQITIKNPDGWVFRMLKNAVGKKYHRDIENEFTIDMEIGNPGVTGHDSIDSIEIWSAEILKGDDVAVNHEFIDNESESLEYFVLQLINASKKMTYRLINEGLSGHFQEVY